MTIHSPTFRKPKNVFVRITSVFAAHWILHSRNLRGKWKMYYIIKLYYFVAVLSLTYTPILPTFFLNKKNVDKIKKLKT